MQVSCVRVNSLLQAHLWTEHSLLTPHVLRKCGQSTWFESDLHHFTILTNYLNLLLKEENQYWNSGNLIGIRNLTYKRVHCFLSGHCHDKKAVLPWCPSLTILKAQQAPNLCQWGMSWDSDYPQGWFCPHPHTSGNVWRHFWEILI